MKFANLTAAALSLATLGSMLSSCSQPDTNAMLTFNEVETSNYTSQTESSALTIYVDANASENGNGSEKKPFKTIQEAQAKIRELKSGEGLPQGGITVFVKDGEYTLTEGLVFSEEDSGTAECLITYVSESEFGAKITGALLLSAEDFEPINDEEKSRLMDKSAADNIVKVDLAKYGLTSEDWGDYVVTGSHHTGEFYDEYADAYANAEKEELLGGNAQVPIIPEAEVFIGDQVLQCARWPNNDWVYMQDLIYFGQSTWDRDPKDMRNPDGPIIQVEQSVMDRVSKWSTLEDVWTFGYISTTWADSRNKVVNFDFDNNSIQLRYSETFLSINNKATTRWYFFNIFDELDAPGEFYIDREKGILYICKTDDFHTERIKMSTLGDSLITLKDASNLTIKGFYISETRTNGIKGTAENVTIDNCKICNIRSGAIRIIGNKITIQNNEICNMGTYGIYLEGGDMDTLTRSENVIYNNYIHDWARVVTTYQTGIQVEGVGSLVSHNEICNSAHQAVTWHGPYHIMEYNEVYNVLKETADCGAFYTGRNLWSYGCEVRYNYIHDIGREGAFACGIYWDDGLSGQKAYGNLLINIPSHAFLVGGGRDCYVYNNVIIDSNIPINHDGRMRQYTMKYHNAWFSHIPAMCEELKPYLENDVWMKAFPEYEGLILYDFSYDGDLNDPMLVANPTGAIYNNITYMTIPEGAFDSDILKHNFQFDIEDYCDIGKNPIIYNDFGDFPDWHNGDFSMKKDSKAKEKIPEFKDIPYAEMGRIE